MKKLMLNDLYNTFDNISFKMSEYKYLFHNTSVKTEDIKTVKIFTKPAFYYFMPFSFNSKYGFDDRKCMLHTITKDIDNVLDLTTSIISKNIFTEYLITKNEMNSWISYDNLKVSEYYDPSNINIVDIKSKKEHQNNKCITTEKIDIHNFLKKRKYCDIAETMYYSGRRKLQEMLFKTRKYEINQIWYFKYIRNKSIIENLNPHEIYHNINLQDNLKINFDFEKYILEKIGLTGFFYTDYAEAYKSGGEIMLIKPNEYLKIKNISNKLCIDKTAFDLSEFE
jgi:hypothetical protein